MAGGREGGVLLALLVLLMRLAEAASGSNRPATASVKVFDGFMGKILRASAKHEAAGLAIPRRGVAALTPRRSGG